MAMDHSLCNYSQFCQQPLCGNAAIRIEMRTPFASRLDTADVRMQIFAPPSLDLIWLISVLGNLLRLDVNCFAASSVRRVGVQEAFELKQSTRLDGVESNYPDGFNRVLLWSWEVWGNQGVQETVCWGSAANLEIIRQLEVARDDRITFHPSPPCREYQNERDRYYALFN